MGCSEYYEFVNHIHTAGLNLLDLVNEILDLAKVEAGKDEVLEEVIEISEVIRSVTSLVQNQAKGAGVEVKLEIDKDLPALRADAHKIRQILSNLLTNAIKFTKAGGMVTIRAGNRPESGYRIQIVDTGIGIAPEDIAKALSKFGQVDSNLTRRYEGTGLGLPLTRALVELHGGMFDLQSEVGVGTKVTIQFPATRVVNQDVNRISNIDDRAA